MAPFHNQTVRLIIQKSVTFLTCVSGTCRGLKATWNILQLHGGEWHAATAADLKIWWQNMHSCQDPVLTTLFSDSAWGVVPHCSLPRCDHTPLYLTPCLEAMMSQWPWRRPQTVSGRWDDRLNFSGSWCHRLGCHSFGFSTNKHLYKKKEHRGCETHLEGRPHQHFGFQGFQRSDCIWSSLSDTI